MQPATFSFHCIMDRSLLRAVSALPLGTSGFGEDLPALLCVVGDRSMYAETRDRNLIFIDYSLAAMQFMLAPTARGLGSVPINWPDVPENHQALRELLQLESHHVPVMLIGVGWPDESSMIPSSARRRVAEVLRFHE